MKFALTAAIVLAGNALAIVANNPAVQERYTAELTNDYGGPPRPIPSDSTPHEGGRGHRGHGHGGNTCPSACKGAMDKLSRQVKSADEKLERRLKEIETKLGGRITELETAAKKFNRDEVKFETGLWNNFSPAKGVVQLPLATSKRITFTQKYKFPPVVSASLAQLDVSNSKNLRAKVYVTDIDTTGCTLHADTWWDTIYYSAAVSWVAIGC